jgi:hypothetical protein
MSLSATSITRVLSAAVLVASFAADSVAQTSVSAVVGGSLDSVDRQVVAASDSATPAGSFTLEQLALAERLRLFYALDGGTFTTEGDWHYVQHGGGGRYRFDVGERAWLFVGGTGSVRLNGESWSTANYRALGAFTNLEVPYARGTFRTGVRADRRVFDDQPELDQTEVSGFASVLVNLPSRTTLIGEATLGSKRFDAGALSVPVPMPVGEASHTLLGATTPSGQGAAGQGSMGQGQGNAASGSSSAGGWRGGNGQVGSYMVAVPTESPDGSRARQFTIFGRVAQSLADRLAATIDVTWREAGGAVAPAVVTTPEMMIDDGVYDDPYASDATVVRAGIKRVFEVGRELEAGVSIWSKYYENTPAFDATGTALAGVMREDDIWRVEASWREPLLPSRTGPIGLALLTTYTFMDSTSTDAFYDYRSHRARVLLAISY